MFINVQYLPTIVTSSMKPYFMLLQLVVEEVFRSFAYVTQYRCVSIMRKMFKKFKKCLIVSQLISCQSANQLIT